MQAEKERLYYLDGLRGVGAAQVVLMHLTQLVVSFSRPVPPWYWLFDGQLAVFIFFPISGFVLTGLYDRSTTTVRAQFVSRAVRLFIPATASIGLAVLVWGLLQFVYPMNVGFLHSTGVDFEQAKALLEDVLIYTPLVGYPESSLFLGVPGIGEKIARSVHVNPILWTISVEFIGSVLVIALSAIKRRTTYRWVWTAVSIGAAVYCSRSLLSAFPLAFLLYHYRPPTFRSIWAWPCLVGALAGAWAIEAAAINGSYYDWAEWLARQAVLLPTQSAFSVQLATAGFLIFLAVLTSGPAQTLLSTAPFRFLGRVSFPLYLAHWPMLFVFIAVRSAFGPTAALVAFSFGVMVAVWLMLRVDDAATALARRISTVRAGRREYTARTL